MRTQGKVYSLDKFERLSFDSTATASVIAKFKNEEKKDSLSSGIFTASLGVRLMDIYNLTDEEKNDITQSGKIAINIIIDDDGKVSSATYSPRYSTLVNQKMVEIAKKHALKLKFSEEDKGKKGTIVFSFKLR